MMHRNLQIFLVELIGTFVLVVFATGVIVYDAQIGMKYGVWIAAAGPFVALIIGVYAFGKISMAHFNPAVTIGYYITGHITKPQIVVYFAAEIVGAILGSLFVMNMIGTEANLGVNAPNLEYAQYLIFPVEVLASGMLMAVVYAVVYTKGLKGFSGIAIGGIVAVDILLLSFVSGASMNPARALAPALLSGGAIEHLWLYWSAPFLGAGLVAVMFRKKFTHNRKRQLDN